MRHRCFPDGSISVSVTCHMSRDLMFINCYIGNDVDLSVTSLDDALTIVPVPADLSIVDREEDLDVEDIFPENDLELMDMEEKYKQQNAERLSVGWK